MSDVSDYDRDFYAWAMKQAGLLRAGRLSEADLSNIADEIEGMGRSEKRELVDRLAVLLRHLLRWQVQPAFRGDSWRLTAREQRARLTAHLDDNPSLRGELPDAVHRAYRFAMLGAQKETGLGAAAFPPTCPWTEAQVMSDAFLPE